MKTKKLLASFVLVALAFGIMIGTAIIGSKQNQSFSIVATNFVSYDFSRAILGDGANIKMLIKPASETHSYEPTPQDIIDITKADFFVYIGGESDEWVDEILRDNNIDSGKTLRLMDYVSLKTEEGEEDEYDEHIWTSPVNAIRIIEAMRDRFVAKNPAKQDKYTDNASKYTASLKEIDQKIRDIVASAKRKELVFADRFPFRYFADEYGLAHYAAFPGCSDQTEASSSTIASLVDRVKADNIPVVLKIELTSDALAKTIAQETGAKILTLSAAHNISQADFDAGKTYADIMADNLAVLEEALK